MMDKDRAAADQATAWIGDSLPPLWRRLYANCIVQGFSHEDALGLLMAYILSQCPSGINWHGRNQ